MDGQGYAFEIIVVDDGSTDSTADTVEEVSGDERRIRLVLNRVNMGKGYSVRHGISEAAGDVVLFSDADLSTPIEEYDRLLPHLDRFDIVIASRSLPDSDIVIHQPIYREMMGRVFNALVQMLLVRGIVDTQCGFKLMRTDVGRRIAAYQRINRFSFDVEMLLVARRLGYSFVDIPVRWINSPGSRVQPLRDSFNMLLDLFRIKLYDIAGCYREKVQSQEPGA